MAADEGPGCLTMWTIYRSPDDLPDVPFVVRPFHIRTGRITPSTQHFEAQTLDEARAAVPPDLFCMSRSEDDDAQIVETWI